MNKITIHVQNSELLAARSERAAKLLVWQKGRDAGIPWEASVVTGDVRACHGVLTVWEDFDNDCIVVEWEPEEVQPPKALKSTWFSRLMERLRS